MKICGIYYIINNSTGKMYIGSSNDIHRRFYIHKRKLRKQTHENPHLQLAWNKYGEGNFNLIILEECLQPDLLKKEQYYLSKAEKNPKLHYNCNFCSTKPPSPKGIKHDKNFCEKMSILMSGEKNHRFGKKDNLKTLEKKRNSHIKTDHFFITPENEIVNIRNLKQFCVEHNLNEGGMYGVYKGRHKQYKGWRKGSI